MEDHPTPSDEHSAPPAVTVTEPVHPAPSDEHPTPPAETVTKPVHPAPSDEHPAPPPAVTTKPAPPHDTEEPSALPTATKSAPSDESDECVERCNADYNACRTAPYANQSYCASKYAECLGYLPFDEAGSLVHPTACSSQTKPAPTGPAPVTTPGETKPIITSVPTFSSAVSNYLPATTSGILEANGANKRDVGVGAFLIAGVVAAIL